MHHRTPPPQESHVIEEAKSSAVRATPIWHNARDRVRLGGIALIGIAGLPVIQQLTAPDLDWYHAMAPWLAAFTVIAVGGIALALAAPAGQSAQARRRELIAFGLVAIAWRAVAFVAPPHYSLDAYRYTWDAHLLLHGVSPYLTTPDDPAIARLRDAVVWPILTWRTSPTIYPPGAQAFFVLIGLIAPLNIWGLKAGILLCDLGTMVLTSLLLRRAGVDPRRAAFYWLSPIPVLEFAFNAHVDALAILATFAAIWLAEGEPAKGRRTWAGIALGVATLTKIYPLLFAVVLLRRNDRGFLAGLGGTIAAGYLAMLPFGIGGGGFLGTYFRQRYVDQGILQHYLGLLIVDGLHGSTLVLTLAQGLLILGGCGLVAWWRWRGGVDVMTGVLAISVVWLLLSPHIFPWYVAALLPPLAVTMRSAAHPAPRPGAPWPSFAWGIWLFTLSMPFTYVLFAPDSGYASAWFHAWFLVPLAVMLSPPLLAYWRHHTSTSATGRAPLTLTTAKDKHHG